MKIETGNLATVNGQVGVVVANVSDTTAELKPAFVVIGKTGNILAFIQTQEDLDNLIQTGEIQPGIADQL